MNQALLVPKRSPPPHCPKRAWPLVPSPSLLPSPPLLPAHLSHQHLKVQVMTHLHQEASPWGQDSRLVHLRKNKQTKTQKNMTSMASPAPASNRCLPSTCGVESGAPRSCRGHLPPPSTGPSPPQLGFRLTLAPPPGSHLQAFARTALEHCPLQLPRPERHPGLSSNVTSRPHLGPVPASEQPPTGGGALTHGWGRG